MIDTHTPPTNKSQNHPNANSIWMVTYMTPWSPIGYMEDAINHDCRGAGGREICLLGSNKERRGAESILQRGGFLGKNTTSL